ncbi:hypothetical protein LGK97_19290 [Clostridium sp. CS001]|uniref:hypothetical protein n=1 Tax=Clostridium sp. CS001 TaxID=2880648 RepID=UPI001CF39AF3|nr:hypothetical protein [Clostridium sp. CS001]MCB2291852.1 hypothetical protein [Clostridium sp. CS001]
MTEKATVYIEPDLKEAVQKRLLRDMEKKKLWHYTRASFLSSPIVYFIVLLTSD